MIRERIKINVTGTDHLDIKNKVLSKLSAYFDLDKDQVLNLAEIEIDVTQTEDEEYSAVAYVKLRNNA